MKATKFVRPLLKKGGWSHAPNCSTDYASINEEYRKRLGGNPFNIRRTSEEKQDAKV